MALPIKRTVDLFYDVASPYAWIAFEVLCRYRAQWNIDLRLKPVVLAAIFKQTGNAAPAMVVPKREYIAKDLERIRDYFQVPINTLSDPIDTLVNKGTLKALRLIVSIDRLNTCYVEKLSRELWMDIWSKDLDLTQSRVLIEAGKRAGIADIVISDALSKIGETVVKDKLKANTEEAIQCGAFGVPTILAHIGDKKELFFGCERFQFLADVLGVQYNGPVV